MKDWALILGASSGFGAASAKELAVNGFNIFGVHLDRKSAHDDIQNLIIELIYVMILQVFHQLY